MKDVFMSIRKYDKYCRGMMLRLFLDRSLILKSVPRFWFFHEHYVDHNASVVLLFLIARGKKNACVQNALL